MKSTFTLTFLLFVLLYQNAYAANESGSGGGAIVCREDAQITRSVSYDLWRGENDGVVVEDETYYLDIKRHNSESAQRQAYRAIERFAQFNSELAKPFKMVLDTVIKKIDLSLSAVKSKRLPTKNDFTPIFLPEEEFCPGAKTLPDYETAAIYYDSSKVEEFHYLYYLEKKHLEKDTINVYTKVIKNFETSTDLAALYVHEAIYKIMRLMELVDNSDLVSEVVALLFSESENELLYRKCNNVFKPIISRHVLTLSDMGYLTYFYPYLPSDFIKNLSFKLFELNNIEEIKMVYNYSGVFEGVEYKIVKDHVIKKRKFVYKRVLGKEWTTTLTDTILSMAIKRFNVGLVEFLLEQDGFSVNNTINGYHFGPRRYNMYQVAEGTRPKRKSLNKAKKNKIIKILKNNI